MDADIKSSINVLNFNGLKTTSADDLGFDVAFLSGLRFSTGSTRFGFEITFGGDSAKSKKRNLEFTGIHPRTGSERVLFDGVTNEFSRKYYANMHFLLGRMMFEDYFLYLKMGVSYGRFEFKYRHDFTRGRSISGSQEKGRFGVVPGIGLESSLGKGVPVTLRVEYSLYLYQNFKTQIANPLPGRTEIVNFAGRVRPIYHSCMLAVVYPI